LTDTLNIRLHATALKNSYCFPYVRAEQRIKDAPISMPEAVLINIPKQAAGFGLGVAGSSSNPSSFGPSNTQIVGQWLGQQITQTSEP